MMIEPIDNIGVPVAKEMPFILPVVYVVAAISFPPAVFPATEKL
jgi:hypothetical protein